MNKDYRKNIDINYNLLNLPYQIKQNDTVKAKYAYLADGTKLSALQDTSYVSATIKYGNVIVTVSNGFDYLGSFVYTRTNNSQTLESAAFGGGRINKTSSTNYDINYFITDHLGSTRVIVDKNGYIKEQKDYYAFGTEHENPDLMTSTNRWGYNGKEKQTIRNLNYLDYGARMLRDFSWISIDPLCEMYYSISPYAYCLNNPLRYIDPTGMYSTEQWMIDNGLTDDDLIPLYRAPITTTDAGHGDKPQGSKYTDGGATNGTDYEKDYALMVEEQVDYWLGMFGVDNQRTRTGDVDKPNDKSVNWRWRLANENGSIILVSIHLNNGSDAGLFIMYDRQKSNSNNSILLGNFIANSMTALLVANNHLQGYSSGAYALLSYFKGEASVIVELGGIANAQTINAIKNNASGIGYEIATGICNYLNRDGIKVINTRTEWVGNWFNWIK
jgi:RHS repeat-associated protein